MEGGGDLMRFTSHIDGRSITSRYHQREAGDEQKAHELQQGKRAVKIRKCSPRKMAQSGGFLFHDALLLAG